MKLDTATILVISIVTDIVLLLILIHAWRTRTTYPGFGVWILATACWVVGPVLTMLLPAMLPQFFSKIIGNALVLLHPLLLYEGINQFHGIRRRWWGTPLNTLLVSATVLFLTCFFYVSDDIRARSVAISWILAILFLRTSLEPLLKVGFRRYSMQWLLSASLIPLVTMLFLRGWFLCSGASFYATLPVIMIQDTLLRWIMFYGIIVELIIAYSYLSLTSDRVEQELRKTEERERNIAEAQRQFFGMVTHEFKTPLAVINRSAQMIAYTAATADDALIKRVTTIRENSVNLINLLDACMNDSVMARGELHLTLSDFDLALLLKSVRQHFSDVWPERILELAAPDTPQMYHGDERLIFHLATNLVDNALKFSALPVHIRLLRTADAFCITVSDQGVGVPDAEIRQLGERTFRASTAQGISGTGIGLHTARLIAGLHHGTITFASSEDKKTIVTVLLPV